MDLKLQLILIVVSFLAGIGITAIGPGGIFLTIALYALTALAPPEVAGTAMATFIATGILGTLIYLRSGELRARKNLRIAWPLSLVGLVGALVGSWANPWLPAGVFGALLGVASVITGALIVRQAWRGISPRMHLSFEGRAGHAQLAVIGFAIGFFCGLLGLGGPVLAVPVLVIFGVPMLVAVAVAQVQSIFVAAFATAGFAMQGAMLWPMVLWLGIPQLIGALIGWRIAHRVPAGRLKVLLGVILIVLGPFLLF